jgi:choline kinase
MRAVILAAGMGKRLGAAPQVPKCLLRFGGKTLLHRHLELLAGCGVGEIAVAVGYRRELVEEEVAVLAARVPVAIVPNPDFQEGSVVTLWTLRHHLTGGGPVLVMDGDVLYGQRMIRRLIASPHPDCLLLDRDLEAGEEPVKVCVRGGAVVEFRKQIDPGLDYDYQGESVGFFRLSEPTARRLAQVTEGYVEGGRRGAPHEEALRDLMLADAGHPFGFEDVTGLPWVEIDFPADVVRARQEVWPRLQEL